MVSFLIHLLSWIILSTGLLLRKHSNGYLSTFSADEPNGVTFSRGHRDTLGNTYWLHYYNTTTGDNVNELVSRN